MSTGLYSITTRAAGTILTASIYNADHQNHVTNQNPQMTGAYSDTVAQMQTNTDPGDVGSESLAGSLAGELERIRAMFLRVFGLGQWYSKPGSSAFGQSPSVNTTGSGFVLAGPFYSFRNVLINGGMAIDQRNEGAAQTFTAGAALAYSIDRWYGYCTGANVTGQRVAGSGNNQYRYQFTGAALVTAIGFGQRIEQKNSYHLAGKNAVFSVDLANSLLTTVTWALYYANSADSFGTLAAPTRTQIATGSFAVTNTVTNYNTGAIAIPAAATTGLELVLSVGAQTSGTWTIGEAQLEIGSNPTAFDRRESGAELRSCRRYFNKTFPIGTAVAQNSGTVVGALNSLGQVNFQAFSATWEYGVEMRASPTVVTYAPDGATGNWSTSGNTPNATLGAVGPGRATIFGSVNVSAGNQYTIHASASTEL